MSNNAAEVFHGISQPLPQGDKGLPSKSLSGQGNVGVAAIGIVSGQGVIDYPGMAASKIIDHVGQFPNRCLHRMPQVHRATEIRGHEADQAIHHIAYVAERASLSRCRIWLGPLSSEPGR